MNQWVPNSFADKGAKVALGVASGAGVALLAFLLLAIPPGQPSSVPFLDKIQHFLAFAFVTGPAILALSRRYWPFWLTHMMVLAAGTEIAQGMSQSGRVASFADFLADLVGIAVAVVIGDFVRRNVLKRL